MSKENFDVILGLLGVWEPSIRQILKSSKGERCICQFRAFAALKSIIWSKTKVRNRFHGAATELKISANRIVVSGGSYKTRQMIG